MKNPSKKLTHCKLFAVATPNIVMLINEGPSPNARKQVGTTPKQKDIFLKNTILLLFFLIYIFCSVRLFGQDTIPQSSRQSPTLNTLRPYVDSEMIRHQWDVSVNLLDLIGKGNNVSLFFRKNYVNHNNDSRAFRLRIMPYFLSAHSVGVKRSAPTVGLFFAPGYEWQQRSGRFMLFYGMDIRFNYDYSKVGATIGIGGLPGTSSNYDEKRYWEIGAAAFLGARYFINHRFSLAIESQLTFTHARLNEKSVDNGVVTYQHEQVDFQLSYFPLYFLNLSYHF
ncbi:hypothetical protein GVN20_11970 [Runella sp. CRIBMP]|uniref:hypothetical protein n=1 Tax=Runella sp. CRIBMP TaxID=2683261 RepID=UPI001411CD9B|nr:hypothetical protein [Runella sp. CRIBMP]NBB20072.1 hypothetical protein [Runella sp. CRIBMP]